MAAADGFVAELRFAGSKRVASARFSARERYFGTEEEKSRQLQTDRAHPRPVSCAMHSYLPGCSRGAALDGPSPANAEAQLAFLPEPCDALDEIQLDWEPDFKALEMCREARRGGEGHRAEQPPSGTILRFLRPRTAGREQRA